MGEVIPFGPPKKRIVESDDKEKISKVAEIIGSVGITEYFKDISHEEAVSELCKMMKLNAKFATLVNTCKPKYNKYESSEQKKELKNRTLDDLITEANNVFGHSKLIQKPSYVMALYNAIFELTFPTNPIDNKS